jgi:hypothetical protein
MGIQVELHFGSPGFTAVGYSFPAFIFVENGDDFGSKGRGLCLDHACRIWRSCSCSSKVGLGSAKDDMFVMIGAG